MITGLSKSILKQFAPALFVLFAMLLIYIALGLFERSTLQAVATMLTVAIPVAYVLGLQMAKAHMRGLERGVDTKVAAQRQQRKRTPAPNRDRYLPDVRATEALIVTRGDDGNEPIDL